VRHPHRRGGAGIRDLDGAGDRDDPFRRLDRRAFLGACAGLLLWPLAGRAADGSPEAGGAPAPGEGTDLPVHALETSPFVYVCPLRAGGEESTCHAEVWFAWLDGAVVINTAPTTWKARALARGLDHARIWVGDHGRWKGLLGTSDAFRQAPHFDARARAVRGDDALLERLLATYTRKYPREIGAWVDKMRAGYHDGSRLLVRYEPIAGSVSRSDRT